MSYKKIQLALDSHRDEIALPIRFDIRPDGLMDKNRCKALSSRIGKICNHTWEYRRATRLLAKDLPSVPGLYMFAWRPTWAIPTEKLDAQLRLILYVGQAGGTETRYSQSTIQSRYKGEYSKLVHSDPNGFWIHKPRLNRKERLSHLFSLWELEFWFLEISNTDLIIEIETALIMLLCPPGNYKENLLKAKMSKSSLTAF